VSEEERLEALLREALTPEGLPEDEHRALLSLSAALSQGKGLVGIEGASGLALELIREAVVVEEPRPRPLQHWGRTLGALAAGVLGALVLSQFLLRTSSERPLHLKGGDALAIGVKRAGARIELKRQESIRVGDEVGFFYTAARAGYLAILSVGEDGTNTVVFPAQADQMAFVEAGAGQPVSDGAVAEAAEGCEFVVALFSDEPLPLAAVAPAFRVERRGPECRLWHSVPGLRTIDTWQVRR